MSRTISVWPINLPLCNYLRSRENLNSPKRTVGAALPAASNPFLWAKEHPESENKNTKNTTPLQSQACPSAPPEAQEIQA